MMLKIVRDDSDTNMYDSGILEILVDWCKCINYLLQTTQLRPCCFCRDDSDTNMYDSGDLEILVDWCKCINNLLQTTQLRPCCFCRT